MHDPEAMARAGGIQMDVAVITFLLIFKNNFNCFHTFDNNNKINKTAQVYFCRNYLFQVIFFQQH